MIKAKADVSFKRVRQRVQRIGRLSPNVVEFCNQPRERGITDFYKNRVFVRKIDVKRSGGDAELGGDSTNCRGGIPFFDKQLLGCVENLSSPLRPLSFSFSTTAWVRVRPSFHLLSSAFHPENLQGANLLLCRRALSGSLILPGDNGIDPGTIRCGDGGEVC